MRLSLRLLLVVSALIGIALLLSLTGCPKPTTPPTPTPPASTGQAPTGEPIVIGGIFSVTGNGAPLGEPEKLTAEMVVKQMNDAGGIGGRPIKLIIEDDTSDDTKAVMAAKKLIEQDKVLAIIGPTISSTSLAIGPTCEQAQVPLISCAASIKITNPVNKWIFSTAPTDVLAVARLVAYMQASKITQVAIICDSNAFGQSGADQLRKQLPPAGIKIIQDEKFDNKSTDMTAQLTKIKAGNPQAVICWGTNPGPAIVAKNAATLGLKAKMIMSHGIANKKFIELAGPAAEGIILAVGKIMVPEETPASDPQKATLVKYAQEYQALSGKPASTFGGHAYDALYMIRDAITKGAKDRATLRDGLEATKGFVGIGGVFTMSPTNHSGLNKDCYTLVTVKDGAWKMAK